MPLKPKNRKSIEKYLVHSLTPVREIGKLTKIHCFKIKLVGVGNYHIGKRRETLAPVICFLSGGVITPKKHTEYVEQVHNDFLRLESLLLAINFVWH